MLYIKPTIGSEYKNYCKSQGVWLQQALLLRRQSTDYIFLELMHALRAHCGSYLHDSLRHQWLTEEERRAMEEQDSARRQQPEESGGEGPEETRAQSGLPSQWPLFGSPTLTTICVTSYKDKGGTIVRFPSTGPPEHPPVSP